MSVKYPKRPKARTENRRTPISGDFGTYLKALRIHHNISVAAVAEGLSLAPRTVKNIEDGYNPVPTLARVRLWLGLLGESSRYAEASRLLRQIKTRATVVYIPRNPANEHIDRLLSAYETGRLSDADLKLLQMIAPREYT